MTRTPMFHPLSLLFPAVEGDDFKALVADIGANGLRQPITLYDDKILDGRTRFLACREAGVEPRYETYTGDDPVGYVVSLNIARRHMTESQRAMVAAKIATLRDGQRKSASPIGERATTQAEAADMLNVGKRSVERARDVLDVGTPPLQRAVESGEISVHAAAVLARHLTVDEQGEIVARGREAILQAALILRQEERDARRAGREHIQAERADRHAAERAELAKTLPPWQPVAFDGPQRRVKSYDDLVELFIERRKQLGWTQEELDTRAGFTDGYASKLEAWRGPQGRVASAVTMPLWWEALGLELLPVLAVDGTIEEQRAALEAIEREPLEGELAHRRRA